jgi:hypothetical protein
VFGREGNRVDQKWHVIGSQTLMRDRWIDVRADDCITSVGVKISPYYVLTYPDWVHADAAAIRAAFDRGGELSAAVELRRLFPGVADNAQARECARTIAAWKPLPATPAGALGRRAPIMPRRKGE